MCTLLILYRPNNKWPLILAGNRDEMKNRPWLPPGKHWPNYNGIIAGKDITAGGSWLGINNSGLVATILNRPNSLGPNTSKNSRGNIIIDILKNETLNSALNYIKLLDNTKWKPFNLFIANNKKAYWVKSSEKNKVSINIIPEGKHFLDSYDLNSNKSERYINNKNKFKSLDDPNPDKPGWHEWINFLANKSHPKDKPFAAMNITDKFKKNYGTLSSSIIALPADSELNKNIKPLFLFSDISPDNNKFYNINTC
jgi:predicted transcriptional regulator